MEVFWNAYQDRVMDIALDIAGYVLAGGLWLLVYSAWQARKMRRVSESVATTTAPATASVANAPLQSEPTAREGRRTIEFVSFRDAGGRATNPPAAPDYRRGRHRAVVFAVARKMLADGVSADSVKSELPISDGELALLDAKRDN